MGNAQNLHFHKQKTLLFLSCVSKEGSITLHLFRVSVRDLNKSLVLFFYLIGIVNPVLKSIII